MTTATKKAPKKKAREFRDLKSLGKALGTKPEKKPTKAKVAKPAAPPRGSTATEHDLMVEAGVVAARIRGKRHQEDGLVAELRLVKKAIKADTDYLVQLHSDMHSGQSRLDLKVAEQNTGTRTRDAKAAATKAAHAPVTNASSTLLDGKRIVVTRTGDEFTGSIVGKDERFGPHRTFRGAAEAVLGSIGVGQAAVRTLKWEPYEANGKAETAPAAASTAPSGEAAKATEEPAGK